MIETDLHLTQCAELLKSASSTGEAFGILQTISQKIYQAEDLIMIERDADPILKALLDRFGMGTTTVATSTEITGTSTASTTVTITASSTATTTTQ